MHKILLLLFVVNYIFLSDSFIIQPKGPTHRSYVLKCIDQITIHAYNFIRSRSSYYSQYLLTYIITRNLNTPGFEIQEEVLKILHNQSLWSIEVLQYGREDFKSHSENCISTGPISIHNLDKIHQPPDCKRKHVMHLKSHVYIIIVEDIEMFYKKLDHIVKTSSFNDAALYIIYYTKINLNNDFVATTITDALHRASIRNMILMIPESIKQFNIYILKIENRFGSVCFRESTIHLRMPFQCVEGKLISNGVNIFDEFEIKDYYNCTIFVDALPLEPFVINQRSGMEIDIMKEIGNALNITFDVKMYTKATQKLGSKTVNGSWVGFLRPIWGNWHLGIGNIPPENKYLKDFTYSVGYYAAKVVCVVPIAALIPRWRVLMVIFTLEMWGICLAIIFGFSIAFYVFKTKKELKYFTTLERCVEAAFQVFIAQPTPVQPISNFTRVYFISLAIIAIIMNSVYTSSLVYFLQNPVREQQILLTREIPERGLVIGGSPKYKEMFNFSSSNYATMILNSYQTVNESLDTYNYWLKKVASERNIATIAIKLYVNYLILKGDPMLTSRHGEPKVFILPTPLRSEPIGIIMRRGMFLKEPINKVVQRLIIEAGLVNKIRDQYDIHVTTEDSEEEESDNEKDDQDHTKKAVLSPHHLEGAFAILALGYICGFFAFIIELIYYYIRKSYGKKTK